jgi:SAM-dependent methyltransferase
MRFRRQMPTTYAERTYNSPIRIVRYAHKRRFQLICAQALQDKPQVVLDYGSGDAEMLLMLLSDPNCPPTTQAIAFESWYAENLAQHLRELPDQSVTGRIAVETSEDAVESSSCDVVACGNVLEHVTLAQRYRFYDFARRILRPGGRVVIDVPVELGPALLVKTFTRRVIKSYDREYSMSELIKAGVGCKVFDPGRFDPRGKEEFFVSHKGFDYRLLVQEMAGWGFVIERVEPSPVTWLPAPLANQEVIIVASLPT